MDTFQLEIVTPEKKVVDTAATEIQIPGKNGYLGILPGHAPLITELAVGEVAFRVGNNNEEQRLAVAWGFAEVLPDKVTILAETAERPSEIDVDRARKSKERAEQRLSSGDTNVDIERSLNALHKAETRLEVAGKSEPFFAVVSTRRRFCPFLHSVGTCSPFCCGRPYWSRLSKDLSHPNLNSRRRLSCLPRFTPTIL